MKNNYVLMMVLAIFLYVGAEVSMSYGIPLYLKDQFQIDIQKLGFLWTGLFFTALMVGRFAGGILLTWVKPKPFFITTSLIAVASVFLLFAGNEALAAVAVILIGLSFANIFPLVFSITIDHMPEKTIELSGLMIMAIVGGAILPQIMGIVSDLTTSTMPGFLVPLVAVGYVTYVALFNLKKSIIGLNKF